MSDERTHSLQRTLDQYREKINFDEISRISHPQDCYPGNCSLTGYLKDGELRYQEQTGKYPEVDSETPDWNPRGCGRQCSYTDATYGEERIKQPMRRKGERGSGEWEPISWDEAYREIAEAMIDAMEDNPQSILAELPPGEGGATYGIAPVAALCMNAGGVVQDLASATIQDLSVGMHETFGKYQFCSSQDDWFNAELQLVWHMNPAYSRQSSYHFITESRYSGAETVVIAPDCQPGTVHADRYVPVEPASDAALALGISRVVLEEGWEDRKFIVEQTDMPLLVREDIQRYLRESDLEENGHDDRFYFWDQNEGLTLDPRDTLELGDHAPVLEGSYDVEIDGETVTVRPVFERMRDRIETNYDLETVQEISGVHPEVVRELARKISHNRTNILNSWNSAKTFHGDLIERSMALVLGLTGNWGRKGTGMRSWCVIYEPSAAGEETATDPFLKQLVQAVTDRSLTEEELDDRAQKIMYEMANVIVPAHTFWYRHTGYREIWEQAPMESAEMPRGINEYMEEAMEKDYWGGVDLPEEDVDPSVYFLVANNALRNKRGTTRAFLEELWPKLDLIVCCDYRWSTTALQSDIVLPAAFHHEKEQFHSITSPEIRFWSYADQAVEPVHNSRNEMEIVEGIARKITEVADERGLDTYEVPQGMEVDRFNEVTRIGETVFGELDKLPEALKKSFGKVRSYEDFHERVVEGTASLAEKDYHRGGDVFSAENISGFLSATVDHCKETGVFDEEASLEKARQEGFLKYEGLGETVYGLNQAAEVNEDETVTALDLHVNDKQVFPTLTGRAQFYIDHEWFLEADEQLPRHKSPPADHGGDRETYPFYVTSGHTRHSTHGITLHNETQMNLQRGEPHLFISRQAARDKGIEDGDMLRVFNSFGEVKVQAKVSSLPADDQVVYYHGWDPYIYPEGKSIKDLVPGLIKPLHLAGNYGHLSYRYVGWQAQQVGRHVCVDFERVDEV